MLHVSVSCDSKNFFLLMVLFSTLYNPLPKLLQQDKPAPHAPSPSTQKYQKENVSFSYPHGRILCVMGTLLDFPPFENSQTLPDVLMVVGSSYGQNLCSHSTLGAYASYPRQRYLIIWDSAGCLEPPSSLLRVCLDLQTNKTQLPHFPSRCPGK